MAHRMIDRRLRVLEEAKNEWVTILLVGVGAALVVGIVVVFFFKRCQRRKPPQFEDFVDPYGQIDPAQQPQSAKSSVQVRIAGMHNSRFQHLAFQNDQDSNSVHPASAASTPLSRPTSTTHADNQRRHRQSSRVALLEEQGVNPTAPVITPLSTKSQARFGVAWSSASAPRPTPTGRSTTPTSSSVDRVEFPVAEQRIEDFRPPKQPKSTKASKPSAGSSFRSQQTSAEARAAKKAQLISQIGGSGMANNMKMIQSTWQAKDELKDTPKPDVIKFTSSHHPAPSAAPSHAQATAPFGAHLRSHEDDQPYATDANQPDDTLPLGAEAGSYARNKHKKQLIQRLPNPPPQGPGMGEDTRYLTVANNPDDTLPLGAEAGTYRQKTALLHTLQPPPSTMSYHSSNPRSNYEQPPPDVRNEYRPFEDDAAYETSHVYDSMPLGAEAGQYHQFLEKQKKQHHQKAHQIQQLGR